MQITTYNLDSTDFYINEIFSLFGADKNRTKTNMHKFKYSTDLLENEHFYYYGNLKEELCDDNLSQMFSLIKSNCKDSGILTLYNRTFLHHSEYKK